MDKWFLHDLGPRGGYDHYFDPTTGNGLNTPLEDPALFLGDAFGQAVINGLVLATTAGILGGDSGPGTPRSAGVGHLLRLGRRL